MGKNWNLDLAWLQLEKKLKKMVKKYLKKWRKPIEQNYVRDKNFDYVFINGDLIM